MTNEATDRVDIFIPKAFTGEDPNLFVSVNGVNYLLPKGQKSSVPSAVAAEIERARLAEEKFDKKVLALGVK